ncbi:MAG: hypothetical protein OIF57_09765 [Marinobacterium sp.]|nr:hypothetical protein [Marinobacterium sp.]
MQPHNRSKAVALLKLYYIISILYGPHGYHNRVIIPVLPQLHSRNDWIEFCRRETPYCYVEYPQCLVDLQTTYLQLTLLGNEKQGRQAIKYSLGSRLSVEPVWDLIRSCQWQLGRIIQGLESMDFSSNVRDNSLLKAHTDITVRKFFSKERSLVAPGSLGMLHHLCDEPQLWCGNTLARLLANQQFRQFRSGPDAEPGRDANSLLLDIIQQPLLWLGQRNDGRLHLLHRTGEGAPIRNMASLLPDFRPPAPRLLPRRSPLAARM